ncbi:MAG: hypothetical protein FJW79_02920 [Actinobacteria bacterium]|nr:hypothetical protein [Actinomycetota bacterium]
MRPSLLLPPAGTPRRLALAIALLGLLAASCGADGGIPDQPDPRSFTETSDVVSLGAEGDTSGTAPAESTTSEATTPTSQDTTTTTPETTTTTVAPEPCPLPQALPRDSRFGPDMMRLHRATTAFAEGARRLGSSVEAVGDFSRGWGAREPVASALYRMQADLYGLAFRLEQVYAAAGATYSPERGWVFPDPAYPLATLAAPWGEIPAFQAVTLTALFEARGPRAARAFFKDGEVCRLVAAFSTAMDQAVAASSG